MEAILIEMLFQSSQKLKEVTIIIPDLNLQLPSLLWRTNFSMPEY